MDPDPRIIRIPRIRIRHTGADDTIHTTFDNHMINNETLSCSSYGMFNFFLFFFKVTSPDVLYNYFDKLCINEKCLPRIPSLFIAIGLHYTSFVLLLLKN